jgi:hypothetical protein
MDYFIKLCYSNSNVPGGRNSTVAPRASPVARPRSVSRWRSVDVIVVIVVVIIEPRNDHCQQDWGAEREADRNAAAAHPNP